MVLSITLVWTANDGTTEAQPWGYGGVSATTESFYLSVLPSTGPKGETSLSIQVEQILCPYSGSGTNHQRASGEATFPLAPSGGPFPAPNAPKNLFACARSILVTGAHPGSLLQAFAGALPLSNAVVAGASEVTIKLWLPLVAGEAVVIKQTGCNANGTSAPPAIVNPVKSLPAPTIAAPVLTGATSVTVDGVTPGARVSLFVNGLLRSSIDSVEAKVSVPVGWPALATGDKLSAAQALCSEVTTTNDAGGVTVVAPVPVPPSGLGSNSNYILYNNCKPLINVSVTIDVTQDIVCQSASGSTVGFSFQLNAYSLKGKLCALQQYVIALWGNQVTGAVDNWPVTGPNIINDFFNIVSLSSAKIPAGYKLKISLANDSSGNVSAATYIVIDNTGATLANVTQTLLLISGVTAAELAPIVAFELDIVGPVNSESAVLSSGAGTIKYTASSALTVLSTEPITCTETTNITAETANTVYGLLPAGPSTTATQTFKVTHRADDQQTWKGSRFEAADHAVLIRRVVLLASQGLHRIDRRGAHRRHIRRRQAGDHHHGAAIVRIIVFSARTPKTMFSRRRSAARAPAKPRIRPTATNCIASRKTSPSTSLRPAPSAIRTPISRRLLATA